MLYNDMKPEFWYFEILLFFQKFACLGGYTDKFRPLWGIGRGMRVLVFEKLVCLGSMGLRRSTTPVCTLLEAFGTP